MDPEVDDIKQRINNFLVRESSDEFDPRKSVKGKLKYFHISLTFDFTDTHKLPKTDLDHLFDFEKDLRQEAKEEPKQEESGDSFFRDLVSKIEQKHQNGDSEPIDFYQNAFNFPAKEKKPARKYDDEAFKRDLENFKNPFSANSGGEDMDVK